MKPFHILDLIKNSNFHSSFNFVFYSVNGNKIRKRILVVKPGSQYFILK